MVIDHPNGPPIADFRKKFAEFVAALLRKAADGLERLFGVERSAAASATGTAQGLGEPDPPTGPPIAD